MPTETLDYFRLDATQVISLSALAECCGMSPAELDELMDYKALVPLPESTSEIVFSASWVAPLRAVAKLRLDFDLDLFSVAILLEKQLRIELLERQVQSLQAQAPGHLQHA